MLIYALIFLAGLVIGSGICFLTSTNRSKVKELEEQLEDNRKEFESYRDKVGGHFKQTASLFEDMTNSYRAVYEHLAESAHSLSPGSSGSQYLDRVNPGLQLQETSAESEKRLESQETPPPVVRHEEKKADIVEPPLDHVALQPETKAKDE